jgi:hypothetical protein
LWVRRAKIEAEIAELQRQLLEWMDANGTAELDTGDGALVTVHESGAPPALVWRARTLPEPSPGLSGHPKGTAANRPEKQAIELGSCRQRVPPDAGSGLPEPDGGV